MRFVIPLVVLLALVALFAFGLGRDPRELPSPLIGKPAPAFDLPTLHGDPPRMTADDLKGKPLLVNFFASWCEGCQAEHAYLMQLAQHGAVRLVGVDYKDAQTDGSAWLAQRGNPYEPVLVDLDGRTGIDWGVYGVPETFVLDARGVIVAKHIGPMTPEAWARIEPLLRTAAS